jgi:5-methylcytosine-specific restriction endonuclease McrA
MARIEKHCWYCGIKLDGRNHSWDHQNPLGRGGSSSDSNLVRSCQRCNNEKGSMTVDEYRAWLQEMAPWKIGFVHEDDERILTVQQVCSHIEQPSMMLVALQRAGLI